MLRPFLSPSIRATALKYQLAAVFGVPASYLVERGKGTPVLNGEMMDALADEPRTPY